MGEWFFDTFFGWIYDIFYTLQKSICYLLDFIRDIFCKLAGIETVKIDGSEEEILSHFITSPAIRNAFLGVLLVGVILLFVFVIIAIIKSEAADPQHKKTKGQILVKSLQSFIIFLLIPFLLIAGIMLANVVVGAIHASMTGSMLDGNTASTIGGQILVTSGYDAYIGPAGSRAEIERMFVTGQLDYNSLSVVKRYYDLSEMNFFVGIAGGLVILVMFVMSAVMFVQRIFDIILLYIVSPASVSTIPLDDGGRFRIWREMLVSKVLSAYGIILSMNIFFLVVPQISQAYSVRPATDRRARGSERKRQPLGRRIRRTHRRHSGQARARGYAEHGTAGQVQLLLHSGYGQEQNKPYGNPLGHARHSVVGQYRSEDTQRYGTCGIYRAFQKTRSIGRYCRTPRGVFQAYFRDTGRQAAFALCRYGVSFESAERLGRGTVRSAEYKGRNETQTRGKVQSLKADRHGDYGAINTGERQSEQNHRQDDARRNAFGAARAAAKRQRGAVRHDLYHAYIREALQFAYKDGLVASNEADKVRLPKIEPYIGDYYNSEELKELFRIVRGTKIEFPVIMAAYYGLRRSEIVGLKWSAVDFNYKTIQIRHTVTNSVTDGKYILIKKNRTKTKKSLRTLPLFANVEQMLLQMKEEQERYKELFGNSYDYADSEYIYVHENGKLIDPGYITQHFGIVLRNNGLRKIRFHDLRHSCATLLRHNGARMEDIQRWLGHSTIGTTEKICAHFEEEEHLVSAERIAKALQPDTDDLGEKLLSAPKRKSDFEM